MIQSICDVIARNCKYNEAPLDEDQSFHGGTYPIWKGSWNFLADQNTGTRISAATYKPKEPDQKAY